MEGEAVEIFASTFKYPLPKVARTALKTNPYYKANRALALPRSKFRRANPTSDPSLEFCFFLSRKRRKPFGGQPRQASAAEKTNHPSLKYTSHNPFPNFKKPSTNSTTLTILPSKEKSFSSHCRLTLPIIIFNSISFSLFKQK